jgi:hypothetical protein
LKLYCIIILCLKFYSEYFPLLSYKSKTCILMASQFSSI